MEHGARSPSGRGVGVCGVVPLRFVTTLFLVTTLALVTVLAGGPARAQEGSPAAFCPANLAPDAASCAVGGDAASGARPGAIDPGAAPHAPLPSTGVANPFDLATGDKRQSETDVALEGSSLLFRRHYASADADRDTGLGHGWRHSYQVELTVTPGGDRRIVDSRGRRLFFGVSDETPPGEIEPNATGAAERPRVYRTPLPSDGYLIERGEGAHVWIVPDGRRIAFHGSFPTRIDYPGGRHLTLRYRQLRPVSVTDEAGQTLRLEYTPGRRDGVARYAERDAIGDPGDGTAQPGHLAALVLPDGRRIEYGYDSLANLVAARHEDGTARRYRYGNSLWPNHLTGLVDRSGRRVARWHHDERGRTVAFEGADGTGAVRLTIDAPEDRGGAVGDVGTTRLTNADGAESRYRWRRDPASGANLLLEATGPGCASCPPSGRRYAYGDDGALERLTVLDPAGTPLLIRRHTHDERGRLVRVDERVPPATATDLGADPDPDPDPDPDAKAGAGVLASPSNPADPYAAGDPSTTAVQAAGTPATRTVERREYDGDTHRVRLLARPSVNPAGEHTVETVRDAAGLPIAIVERGWRPRFDDDASPTPSGYAPIERTTRIARDASGRPVSVDGPRTDVEDVLRIGRDAGGRVIAIEPPAAPALRITDTDALGRPLALALGERTPLRLERDADGHVVAVRQGERTLRYERDAAGRLLAVTDADGRTTRFRHDAAGRLAGVTDDLGRTGSLVRDAAGRVTERTERDADGALVRSLTRLFDGEGRPLESSVLATDAEGNPRPPRTVRHEHADAGDGQRVERLVDSASGTALRLALNPLARVATLTAPGGATTTLALDARGRTASVGDALGNVTRQAHDDFGRLVMRDSPDTGRELREHDAAGNVVTLHRVAAGTLTRYAYDAANRLVAREDDDGTTARWRWDEGAGTLLEASNGVTSERFAHDADAHLVRHERTIDGHRFVTAYDYDGRGRLAGKTLPDGQRLRYHYHESGANRGELRAITRGRWFGVAADTVAGEIDLDARDGEAGHVGADGLRATRRFGANGELTELALDRTLDLRYRFDEAGRIVGIDERTLGGQAAGTDEAARTFRYRYSGERLALATGPDGTIRYEHDALGNRLARTARDAAGRVTRDERLRYAPGGSGNRLLERTDTLTGEVIAYRHDTDPGAPSAIGDLVHERDARRRTVALYRNGRPIARYAYNAFGERVKKTVYGADGTARTTYFLYDGTALAAEANADGRLRAQYVYLEAHRPIARLDGAAIQAIHTDHRGAPRLVNDARGRPLWSADYRPFGAATVHREDITLPLRLPGQYADAESGTHHNYLRDYDPATGRYLGSDPIGLDGGPNTWLYALGAPLGAIDPLGLDSLNLGGPLGGLHAIAGDARARGAITEDQYQQAMEGILLVPKPAADSAFVLKLEAVFSHAAHVLASDPRYTDRRMADLLDSMVEAAPAIAGMVALYGAVVATQPQLAIAFTAAGFAFAGAEATLYFGDLVGAAIETAGTDLCDAGGLNAIGDRLAARTYAAGIDVASGALLGGFGAAASVGRTFARPGKNPTGSTLEELQASIGDDLAEAARRDGPIGGTCSFAGDTRVLTEDGYLPIRDVEPHGTRVWARDEASGRTGWRDVLARYANPYDARVHVTARDAAGRAQTIVSNRIHPYFARVAAGALLAVASEGHVYAGDIDGGAWVDAQHLVAGDRLLGADGIWQAVESVRVEQKALEAWNLTVEGYSTYFVTGSSGDGGAAGVWVHNRCFDSLPTGTSRVDGDYDSSGRELYHSPTDGTIVRAYDEETGSYRYYTEDSAPTAGRTGRGTQREWLEAHNTQTGVYGSRRTINGAHNEEAFNESLEAIGGRVVSREPLGNGLYQITYQVPELDRSRRPIPGSFTAPKPPKTVYNPDVHSDASIAERSEIASQRAVFEEGSRESTTTVDGIRFRVYRNPNTGEITNSHIVKD